MTAQTKAGMLNYIEQNIANINLLPSYSFLVETWLDEPEDTLNGILKKFSNRYPLIVRSSSCDEDTDHRSFAGAFLSVPNVNSKYELKKAINTVVNSYTSTNYGNEVLIQPFIRNSMASGVAFNHDPKNGAPYYIISITHSTDTSAVTSGSSLEIDQHTISHYCLNVEDKYLQHIIDLLEKLGKLLVNPSSSLDIEFLFDENEDLYLLQCRPLIIPDKKIYETSIVKNTLNNICEQIRVQKHSSPNTLGNKALYGIMPDWNPAEIIGVHPRPLSFSLYKSLISDEIWSLQRFDYGYRDMRNVPLIYSFYGRPYVDVKNSFNSFLPANLQEDIAEKLVNYYLIQLENNPQLHDKVEFDILYTSINISSKEKIDILPSNIFSPRDKSAIYSSLLSLTNDLITYKNRAIPTDITKIEELELLQNSIAINAEMDEISKIYWLFSHCRDKGTRAFAGLARAGFMATELLKSFLEYELIDESEYQGFMICIKTRNSQLEKDLVSLNKEDFLQKYGHLRPGTYDIRVPSFIEEPEAYFNWDEQSSKKIVESSKDVQSFIDELNPKKIRNINSALSKAGLSFDAQRAFRFIELGIKQREDSKFVFSKSVSNSLTLLKGLGARFGLTTDDLSYLDIHSIINSFSSSYDIQEKLKSTIEFNRREFYQYDFLMLPPVITRSDDVYHFKQFKSTPNFITSKNITSEVADISNESLEEKIVFIENADPGYDWIFSKKIAAFITKYGGSNSHMAIRALEHHIPAVIGAGTQFEVWSKAKQLNIDCDNNTVRVIK